MSKETNKINKEVQRVEIDVVFRSFVASKGACNARAFVTYNNNEAFNILMNQLDKLGLGDQEGKLVFEFIPPKEKMICLCGHSKFAHANHYHWGSCQTDNCKCRKYQEVS